MPTAAYKTCSFCGKEVEEEELESHQLICRIEEVECGNECGFKLPRQMLLQHVKESCRKRKVVCDLCREIFLQEEIEEHKGQCSQQVAACILESGEQIDNSSLSKHMDQDGSKASSTYNKHEMKSEMFVHSCDMSLKEVKPENIDICLKEECNMSEVECVFCDSFVPKDSFVNHYGTCESALVRCGNECGEKKARKELSEHYRNECPKALVPCEHCDKKVERQLLEDHHKECVKFPIPCPQSCGVEIARDDVERHLGEECQKLFLACAYNKMQCSYEGFPAGIMQHVKVEMPFHMSLIKMTVENLQMELASERKRNEEIKGRVGNLEKKLESERKRDEEIKERVGNLEKKLESEMKRNEEFQREIKELRKFSFLWKVEAIADKMEEAKNDSNLRIYSQTFYSSKHGYKLRMMMFPDGDGSNNKGHLGVYIVIMPGHYDSLLKWPFTKLVKFRLVDQKTKGEDIVQSSREFYSENLIKPKDGKCNEKGCGVAKFVSHKVLKSRSYIVNNAIFLEVSVEELY